MSLERVNEVRFGHSRALRESGHQRLPLWCRARRGGRYRQCAAQLSDGLCLFRGGASRSGRLLDVVVDRQGPVDVTAGLTRKCERTIVGASRETCPKRDCCYEREKASGSRAYVSDVPVEGLVCVSVAFVYGF